MRRTITSLLLAASLTAGSGLLVVGVAGPAHAATTTVRSVATGSTPEAPHPHRHGFHPTPVVPAVVPQAGPGTTRRA